jgi:hypothetical protein
VFAIADFTLTPFMQYANGEEDAHQNITSALILLSKKRKKKVTSDALLHKIF